jgi:hypothetical protein
MLLSILTAGGKLPYQPFCNRYKGRNHLNLPEKLHDVLKHEGVVSIVSWGVGDEPHVANTWNSYVVVTTDGRMLIPAGGLNRTEIRPIRRSGSFLLVNFSLLSPRA